MRKRKKKIRFSKRSFRAPSVSASDVQPVTKREKKKEKKRLRKWKKKPRSDVHRMPAVVVKRVGPAHHIEKEYFEASYRATRKGRGFYPNTKALRWTRYYKNLAPEISIDKVRRMRRTVLCSAIRSVTCLSLWRYWLTSFRTYGKENTKT